MSAFRSNLWREWREHRTTLAVLALALPVLFWLISLNLSRRLLDDPLVTGITMCAFVLVALVAVGGELLGAERRGSGLRWLERLPAGLASPFLAKLVLLVGVCAGAALGGHATAMLVAFLRGAGRAEWPEDLAWAAPLGAVVALWTFACSAWTLRGGPALLAALLLLGVIGLPPGTAIAKGYQPGIVEHWLGVFLVACAGVASAVLGFVHGGRLGRGTGKTALLALVPVVPLLAVSGAWTLDRLGLRERLDPRADDFGVLYTEVSDDGSHAFLFCGHEDERWEDMPLHVLRVALSDGSWTRVGGHFLEDEIAGKKEDDGLYHPTHLRIWCDDREKAYLFDLATGAPAESAPKGKARWKQLGSGQWITIPGAKSVVYDPFRGREYSTDEIPFWESQWETEIVVRPGRWLCREQSYEPWFLYDPDSHEKQPLSVGHEIDEALAMLPDGRILFESNGASEAGLVCVDLERDVSATVPGSDQPRVSFYVPNSSLFREPELWSDDPEAPERPVVIRSWGSDGYHWHVFDPGTMTLRTLHAEIAEGTYVRGLPDGWALVLVNASQLVRVDLQTGERRRVFPVEHAD